MARTETIGVVGAAGDLGSKLTGQIINSGLEASCFDTADHGLSDVGGKTWTHSLGELVDASTLIHFCAPSSATAGLTELPGNRMLVLHDSVMASSQEAANRLKQLPDFAGSIAVVHCLMNPENGVAIDSGSDEPKRIKGHLDSLGLKTHVMSADEHDTIMARSQAPFALLHSLLMPDLTSYAKRGVLTPSGEALRMALEDRSAKWTPETLRAILKNPNLPELIADMDELIYEIQRIKPS